MKNYRAVDHSQVVKTNMFKGFAIRNNTAKESVGLLKWIWLCIVEIMFGEELIESIVTTASVDNMSDRYKSSDYGIALNLSVHIPSGVMINIFRKSVIEVLYYKFYIQYLLIEPRDEVDINQHKSEIDCTRIRFSVFKQKFWQIIAFRRIYIFSWVIINASIDLVVYLFSTSISMALISAFIVEGLRRLIKV
ncbi:hypothetical protein [Teredinibacter turnerae]|uniref:hypothetical protein n=1 Tax=Teredinibacter turnerae TaxID=2426 RepID=UPI0012F7CDCD|nr:hypothetical protein [Teredinibacter turnerae]